MREIKAALLLDKPDEIHQEIKERRELSWQMVGGLYPRILTEEVIVLLKRLQDIEAGTTVSSVNQTLPVGTNDILPESKVKEKDSFQRELEQLLNAHSMENGSNTPDFILAEYMRTCLKAFNTASRAREAWYGKELTIGGTRTAATAA